MQKKFYWQQFMTASYYFLQDFISVGKEMRKDELELNESAKRSQFNMRQPTYKFVHRLSKKKSNENLVSIIFRSPARIIWKDFEWKKQRKFSSPIPTSSPRRSLSGWALETEISGRSSRNMRGKHIQNTDLRFLKTKPASFVRNNKKAWSNVLCLRQLPCKYAERKNHIVVSNCF